MKKNMMVFVGAVVIIVALITVIGIARNSVSNAVEITETAYQEELRVKKIIETTAIEETVKSEIIEETVKSEIIEETVKSEVIEETVKSETIESDTTNIWNDLELLAHLVFAEAGGESIEAQRAVATVVLNRVASSAFPNTIRGVIYQKGQYQCTWNGGIFKTPSKTSYEVAKWCLNGGRSLAADYVWQAGFKQGYNNIKIDGIWFGTLTKTVIKETTEKETTETETTETETTETETTETETTEKETTETETTETETTKTES